MTEIADEGAARDPVDVFFEMTDNDGLERLRRKDLGQYNFQDEIGYVSAIRKMALAARDQDSLFVPDEWTAKWQLQLAAVVETLTKVDAFSPVDDPTPNDTKNVLVAEIHSHRNWFSTAVAPYIRVGEIDIAGLTNEGRNAVSELNQSASEATTILAGLKTKAGTSVAGELAEYYDGQATKHEDEAGVALWSTIAAVIIFGALVVALFWKWPLPEPAAGEAAWDRFARGLAPRLLVLGLAAYALAFFSRNYRVARHQQAVNEHKRNALRTYTRFLGAVTSDAQRDLVTAELVRRVFENVETGYISAGTDKTVIENTPSIFSAMRPQ